MLKRRLCGGFNKEWTRIIEEGKGCSRRWVGFTAQAGARDSRNRRCRSRKTRTRHSASVWNKYECSRLCFGQAGRRTWDRGCGWIGRHRIGISSEGGARRQHSCSCDCSRRLQRLGQRVEHLVGNTRQLGRRKNAGSYTFTPLQYRSPTADIRSRRRPSSLVTCTHGIDSRLRLRAGQLHRQ
jgi:hypothetical protein